MLRFVLRHLNQPIRGMLLWHSIRACIKKNSNLGACIRLRLRYSFGDTPNLKANTFTMPAKPAKPAAKHSKAKPPATLAP